MSYIDLGNFGGTLYMGDTPLCEFKFKDGFFVSKAIRVLNFDPFNIPLPMHNYSIDIDWKLFFESQCVACTRYRIEDDLRMLGFFESYNAEQILRYTEARNDANNYWVKCDDDLSCWKPWQIEEMKRRGIM